MLLNILNNGLEEACVRDGFIRRSLTTCNPQGDQLEMILGIADRQLAPAPPATTSRSNNFIEI